MAVFVDGEMIMKRLAQLRLCCQFNDATSCLSFLLVTHSLSTAQKRHWLTESLLAHAPTPLTRS